MPAKKKIPNEGERVISSFIVCMNAVRDVLKKDHVNLSVTKTSKYLGHIWKFVITKEQKENFKKHILEFPPEPSTTEKKISPSERLLLKYHSENPPRPPTSYLIFCKENRAELLKGEKKLTLQQQSDILSAHWKGMSQKEKQPYINRSQELRDSYKKIRKNLLERIRVEKSKKK